MKTEKTKTEYDLEAIYLGERYEHFRISQCFRTAMGEIFRYSGIKDLCVGDSYLVSKDGFIAQRPKLAENPKLTLTEQERLDFAAAKEIIKHVRERKKKAMELKKPHPDIVRAIALLKPFARSMDRINLDRFTDYLRNQLSKPEKRKRRRR